MPDGTDDKAPFVVQENGPILYINSVSLENFVNSRGIEINTRITYRIGYTLLQILRNRHILRGTFEVGSLYPRSEIGQHRSRDDHCNTHETDPSRRVFAGLESDGQHATVTPTGELEQSVRGGEMNDASERAHDGTRAQQRGQ